MCISYKWNTNEICYLCLGSLLKASHYGPSSKNLHFSFLIFFLQQETTERDCYRNPQIVKNEDKCPIPTDKNYKVTRTPKAQKTWKKKGWKDCKSLKTKTSASGLCLLNMMGAAPMGSQNIWLFKGKEALNNDNTGWHAYVNRGNLLRPYF